MATKIMNGFTMDIKIFEGITRKIVPIFVGFAFIGWIVFVAGFGKYNEARKDLNPHYKVDDSENYAFWAGSVIGPVVCILAVVHALLWGFPSAIVGSITAVLAIMYLSAVGYVLVAAGITIKDTEDLDHDDDDSGFLNAVDVLFAGGFITTLFWVFILALWPWYKVDGESFTGF